MEDSQLDSSYPLVTPVLLLPFSRPDTVRRVFEVVRAVKPRQLYIAADGPRIEEPDDEDKCQAARQIVTNVDWDCEVKTLFRKENLGPRMAVSTAVDWFFENVSQGIILEDDCLPDPTFFRFCQELLNKYRDDQRIMAISGDNFQLGRSVTEYSYYFSRFNHCWGWASWRRAWHYYDRDMKQWPSTRDSRYLYDFLSNKRVARYWGRRFETVYRGKIDTWDYQWTFACWLQGGLTIVPKVNLVTNIGFGRKSAHTRGRSLVADLKSEAVSFPLTHPPVVFRNAAADDFEEKTLFGSVPVYKKVVNKLYDLLNG